MSDIRAKLGKAVSQYRADRLALDQPDVAPAWRGPEDFEETAAILEHDQGNTREDAERLARAICGISTK